MRATLPLAACALLALGCKSNDNNDTVRNEPARDQTRTTQPASRPPTQPSTQPGARPADRLSDEARILSIMQARDRHEVEMGKMAQSRGESDGVRRFGERLERDHSEHERNVQSVARGAGIDLMEPAQVKEMLAREEGAPKDVMKELHEARGGDFDRLFATAMRDGHRDMIRRVEAAEKSVRNAQVRDLLTKTLKSLREHERIAADLVEGR